MALFLVDGRHGLSEPDLALARWVRRNAAPGMLAEGRVGVVLNKCEGLLSRGGSGDLEAAGEEALSLGFGEGVTVSAETGGDGGSLPSLVDGLSQRRPGGRLRGPRADHPRRRHRPPQRRKVDSGEQPAGLR